VSNEVQLFQDGEGLAVVGDESAVGKFLAALEQPSREVSAKRLASVIRVAGNAAEAANPALQTIMESPAPVFGRYVKLTAESAQKYAEGLKTGSMMAGPTGDSVRAVVMGPKGTDHLLQIAGDPSKLGAAAMLATPAALPIVAGLLSQLAMEQALDEITEYLATINEKVDDIIRAQKDAVLARVIGVGQVLDEAMLIRQSVGRVSEITWSKVQTSSQIIAETQSYALRQLDAIADKLESKTNIPDLAKAAKQSETQVQEWLAVLARCFQLNEAMAVLELDRVLDAAPEELEQHREGLLEARRQRRARIVKSTEQLIARMDDAAARANKKVLLNPVASPQVVKSDQKVVGTVSQFHNLLGITPNYQATSAKRWAEAVAEVKDGAIKTAQKLGNDSIGQARKATDAVASEIAGAHYSALDATGQLLIGLGEKARKKRSTSPISSPQIGELPTGEVSESRLPGEDTIDDAESDRHLTVV
jgi:hypothetical protein